MDNSWWHMIYLMIGFGTLFTVAELLYHLSKVKGEYSRKFIHITSGLLSMVFPLVAENHWQVLIPCSSFALLLVLSKPMKQLRSINDVERVTHGSLLFPVIVYLTYHFYVWINIGLVAFYLPLIIMAVSDPMAAIVGKNVPYKPYKIFGHSKTVSGSLGFIISAFIIAYFMLLHLGEGLSLSSNENVIYGLCIAIATTLIEAISHKGLDNFLIPFIVMLILLGVSIKHIPVEYL